MTAADDDIDGWLRRDEDVPSYRQPFEVRIRKSVCEPSIFCHLIESFVLIGDWKNENKTKNVLKGGW